MIQLDRETPRTYVPPAPHVPGYGRHHCRRVYFTRTGVPIGVRYQPPPQVRHTEVQIQRALLLPGAPPMPVVQAYVATNEGVRLPAWFWAMVAIAVLAALNRAGQPTLWERITGRRR